MKADAQTEAAVMAVLAQYTHAYEHRNMEELLALFVPDPDVLIIGSGADEKRVGLAEIQQQAERDWAQSETAAFTWKWSLVSAAGSVAWLAADAVISAQVGGQTMQLPFRFTAVLEQRGDKWLFVQMHLSFPAPEQAAGESFPAS